jgi:DNA modification methylase
MGHTALPFNIICQHQALGSIVMTLTVSLTLKSRKRRETLSRLAAVCSLKTSPRNDLSPKLKLVDVPIADLRAAANKTRKLNMDHVHEIATTMKVFGFCAPVLLGKDNVIIDGAVRVEAAKLVGLDHVACILMEHLTPIEQRALRIAVNRLSEKGEWDFGELKVEFEEMIIEDMPIEALGFACDEIDQLILIDDATAIETGPMAPDEAATPIARPGDIIALGRHRLICGDATDPEVLAKLMSHSGGQLAQLVLTDEPYNVPIAGHVSSGDHREFAMASGEMSDRQFSQFNTDWMQAALPYLCEGGILGTFIDWRGNPIVHEAAIGLSLTALNLIVWAKTNAGMGSLYRSQHELLPLFKKGKAPHVNNIALGKRGRWRSNVWTYPGASSLGSDARRGLQDHPTVKPTAMLVDALIDLSNQDDIIIDPFLGSGSTLIAAHNTRRICYGVELDPLYVDVIVRRFEAVTGVQATLVEIGESFAEGALRRGQDAHELTGVPQSK